MPSTRHLSLLALSLCISAPALYGQAPPPGPYLPYGSGAGKEPLGPAPVPSGPQIGSDDPQERSDARRGEQPEDPFSSVETIVITPSAGPVDSFSAPYTESVIDRREQEQRLPRTTPQVFRFTPGVLVQETSPGQGSPFIRGFTGYRNLVQIDGVRFNNSVFRSGPNQYWNTIDPFSTERYELLKGPGSVLAGSDSIGGTVNVFTKSPEGYAGGWSTGGELFYRVASAGESHMARAEASVTHGDNWGVLVGLTGRTFGDVQGGRDIGTQRNTAYDEWAGDIKVVHRPDDDSEVTFLHHRVHQRDVPRTHSTVFGISFAGTTIGDELRRDLDQDRELTYLQYRQENVGEVVDLFSAGVSWNILAEERFRERTGGRRDVQGFDVGTLGLFTRFATHPTSLGTFSFGVDAYRDHVDSFQRDLTSPDPADDIQGPVADDATYDLLGAYIQDEISITERLDVTLGARFQYARADANSVRDPITDQAFSIEESWNAVVGSARFVYAIAEDAVNLYGGVSQGFRAPNLSDLTRFSQARTNEFEIPSPDLDPEDALQYELGIKARSGRSTLQLATFYTDLEDTILRTPTGNTNADGDFEVQQQNVGDGFVWGVELGGSLDLGEGWSVFGNTTFLDGEVDTFPTSDPVRVREPIDRLQPWTTLAGFRWERADGRMWAETTGIYADTADELSTRDERDTERIPPGGTPSYFVWDVRGGFQLTDSTEITLGLENILDEDYRVHGSGSNRPGINLIFGLRLRF